jgi:hypothetical protein
VPNLGMVPLAERKSLPPVLGSVHPSGNLRDVVAHPATLTHPTSSAPSQGETHSPGRAVSGAAQGPHHRAKFPLFCGGGVI